MAIIQRECNFISGGSVNITAITLNTPTHLPNTVLPFCLDENGRGQPTLISAVASLQSSAQKLATEIRTMVDPPEVYSALEDTLEQICQSTVQSIVMMYTYGILKANSRFERKIHGKISCMCTVLDNFSMAKAATLYTLLGQLCEMGRVTVLLVTVWNLLWWMFCERRLIKGIRKCLERYRVETNALLFDITAPSLAYITSPHHINFEDFFGGCWSLPTDLCLDRDVFEAVLRLKYKDGPAEQVIAARQFHVFIQGDSAIIALENWEEAVRSGRNMYLSVILRQRQVKRRVRCPRCRRPIRLVGKKAEWVHCYHCDSSINLTATEAGPDGVFNSSSPETSRIYNKNALFKSYSIPMNNEVQHEATHQNYTAPNENASESVQPSHHDVDNSVQQSGRLNDDTHGQNILGREDPTSTLIGEDMPQDHGVSGEFTRTAHEWDEMYTVPDFTLQSSRTLSATHNGPPAPGGPYTDLLWERNYPGFETRQFRW